MKKMNLNIQLFDYEGAFEPAAYNNMVSQYDANIPTVNRAFTNNVDALEVLKNVAGSPKLSQQTRDLIQGLNNSIEQTASYFTSVRNWADGVVGAVQSILGFGLPGIGTTVDQQTLATINENFANGAIGVQQLADVDTYVNSIQSDVIPTLQNGLTSITDAVSGANNSLPEEVHAALGQTISTNNDDILQGYSNMSQYLTENLESFKNELSSAISDLAAGARGGK